jgi:hypothetical protein
VPLIASYLVLTSDLYKIQADTMTTAIPRNTKGCAPDSYPTQVHIWVAMLPNCCPMASAP